MNKVSNLIGKHCRTSGGEYGTIVGYHHNTLIVDLAKGGTENIYLLGNWKEVSEQTYKACAFN